MSPTVLIHRKGYFTQGGATIKSHSSSNRRGAGVGIGPPKDQQESLPGLMIYYTNLEERSSFSLGVVKPGAAVCSQVLICKQ